MSRLELNAKEYVFRLTDEERKAMSLDEWRQLEKKLVGLGCYDTDFYEDRITLSLTVDMANSHQPAVDTITEELGRMTGRTTRAHLEALEGYGSF